MHPRPNQSGFTLTEVLIALVIFTLAAGFAVPAFGNLIARQRLTASANEALSVLNYARTEAVRQRARVVVCPSRNGSACDGGSNWNQAILFTDTNRNGTRDGDEPVERRWDFSNTDIQVTQSEGGSPSRVLVGGTGLAIPSSGTAPTELRFCSARVDNLDITVVAGVGGPRTQRGDGDDC